MSSFITRTSPGKKTYANDCSLESVQDMMSAMATHFRYSALRKLGSVLTEEDLFQELYFTYLHAKEKYDPGQKVLFSTYCHSAFRYRMLAILEQAKTHSGRYTSLAALGGEGSWGNEDGDDDDSDSRLLAIADDSPYSNPAEAFEVPQEIEVRLERLSPKTRLVALHLLASEVNPSQDRPSTLPEIVRFMNLTPKQIKAVQKELTEKLNVGRLTWHVRKESSCDQTASEYRLL
jgi:DNA-directed RNA polymerase specialized sigma24 family protein